jgi:peptidoglycan/LPS O-acetylase OafA/YrhL
MLLSSSVLSTSGKYQIFFASSVQAFAIAVMMLALISDPESLIARYLKSPPLVFVGALSYSLYLRQQPFLNKRSDLTMCQWPLNLGLAVGCAIASYWVIERPFLRLKDRGFSPQLGSASSSRALLMPSTVRDPVTAGESNQQPHVFMC